MDEKRGASHNWHMEELWWGYPFLTTTATQLGRKLSDGGCTEIQG